MDINKAEQEMRTSRKLTGQEIEALKHVSPSIGTGQKPDVAMPSHVAPLTPVFEGEPHYPAADQVKTAGTVPEPMSVEQRIKSIESSGAPYAAVYAELLRKGALDGPSWFVSQMAYERSWYLWQFKQLWGASRAEIVDMSPLTGWLDDVPVIKAPYNGHTLGLVNSAPAPHEARIEWDRMFITMTYLVGMRSSDPNTHTGCVITTQDNVVLSLGYNGYPRGIDMSPGDPRLKAPTKYDYMVHAEENAILNATRSGLSLLGAIAYVNWMPCVRCARGLIQAGVKTVIYHGEGQDSYNRLAGGSNNWSAEQEHTLDMLAEAGVHLKRWEGHIAVPTAMFRDTHIGDPKMWLENSVKDDTEHPHAEHLG